MWYSTNQFVTASGRLILPYFEIIFLYYNISKLHRIVQLFFLIKKKCPSKIAVRIFEGRK